MDKTLNEALKEHIGYAREKARKLIVDAEIAKEKGGLLYEYAQALEILIDKDEEENTDD